MVNRPSFMVHVVAKESVLRMGFCPELGLILTISTLHDLMNPDHRTYSGTVYTYVHMYIYRCIYIYVCMYMYV